jgi:hypothetical protein
VNYIYFIMDFIKIKRTYAKSKEIDTKRPTKTKLIPKIKTRNDTFDDSYWKDSFDRVRGDEE